MPNFFYTAKTIDGKVVTGALNAKDTRELAQNLKTEGMVLIKVSTAKDETKKGSLNFSINIGFLNRVSISEKMLMTRNLSVMVSTGLPLVKGFGILSAQAKSKRMKEALLDIGKEISRGMSLYDSFKKYPDIFSELFQSMIRVGEESGTLEDVLGVLSLQLEKEKDMHSKLQKALIYPVILIFVMLVVGVCLAIFVLPKINAFFQGLHANLPLTTQIILGSGDFFMKYWMFIIVGVVILVFACVTLIRTKTGKFLTDTALLKAPVVSTLVKKTNAASLIRSLSSLMSAGVPLIKSLEITAGTVNNFYFKQSLFEAAKEIEKGKKLFTSLEPHKDIFPYGALEMVEIGEETGKTALILKKLAEFYEDEVSNAAENISAIIEPVLILIIGLVVGVFAVSIIGPLYSVLGTIS